MATDIELARKSLIYRLRILREIRRAGAGHTGGSLSCVDILNVLYNRILRVSPETAADPRRDRYIQSKGHSVEALYVVLADRGFFPATDLQSMGQYRSPFVGHPTRKVPGIEHNTGALGHGLAFGAGLALGAKRMPAVGAGNSGAAAYRVFVLLGDGELAEGSNWEAAMAGAHFQLENLTAVVDCNQLQISGSTREVMNSEPLDAKFASFGWAVRIVDGHNLAQLSDALQAPLAPDRPGVVIARTVKGKGVSFMEHAAGWHHRVPTEEEYAQAVTELTTAREVLDRASA